MKHIIQKILKRIWHDVVIILVFTILRPLALNCKQATLMTDTQKDTAKGMELLKYKLHLSICTACLNYLKVTEYLEAHYRHEPTKVLSATEITKFNQQLIRKFTAH